MSLLRGIISGLVYDADAQAYFDAVETAGGSFDLTGINALYTENYIKRKHNDFVLALKGYNLWSSMDHILLLSGKTYAAIAVPLKGFTSISFSNFVLSDYLSAGSGLGLTGDALTKYINTAVVLASNSDASMSVFGTVADATTRNSTEMGAYNSAGVTHNSIRLNGYSPEKAWQAGNAGIGANDTDCDAFLCANSVGSNGSLYKDGISIAGPTTVGSPSTNAIHIFAERSNSVPNNYSQRTLSFAHIGGTLGAKVPDLNLAIQTFMTSLGK